jgi:hypothetical protein
MQTGEVAIQPAMTKSLFVATLNSGPVVKEPRSKLKAREGRKSHLQSCAKELAAAGPFERWQSIEFELKFVEGLPEAHVLLAGRRIRKTLDLLCRQARSGTAAADETR